MADADYGTWLSRLASCPLARVWKLRTKSLSLLPLPRLMGILNVTPDSFSDGGRFSGVDAALAQAEQLLADGADILDIGGESTRPYSAQVACEEELQRVIPVIEAIARKFPSTILSIDTSKSRVASEAVERGAEIINDITGLEGDVEMVNVALRTGAGVCAMHMRGTPQNMQDDPQYHDVVGEIKHYLRQRLDSLVGDGIAREKICLDPGIGFGKTHQHNLTLMANVWRYHEFQQPILVGHSRKGFVGKLLGLERGSRNYAVLDAGTAGGSIALALQRVQVLRVHEVEMVKRAIEIFADCGGLDGREKQLV